MAINKNDYLDGNGNYDLKKELVDELIDEINTHEAEIASNFEFYQDDIVLKKPIRQNAWVGITFRNNYTGSARYRRNQTGQLELSLDIRPGTTTPGTLVGVLPAGYRPAMDTVFPLYNFNEYISVESVVELVIGTSGSMYIRGTIVSGGIYKNSIVLP